jgi:signal transduction histidine kinase
MSNINKLSKLTQNTATNDIDLVLEQLHAVVFVCDIKDLSVLYMNKYAKQVYGNGLGKKCWEVFQSESQEPCTYCLNHKLLKSNGDVIVHDHFSPFDDKWYEVQERIIDWKGGQKAKLSISYDIDHRKSDEKKLMILYKQQELFSKISRAFNKQDAFANKVNNVLNLVGNFVDVSRVSIFMNKPEINEARLVYEWNKDGIKPKLNKLKRIKYHSDNPVFKKLVEDNALNVNDLNDAEYTDSLAIFRKFDVRAMLMLPVFLYNRHIGFVNFEDCGEIRVWQDSEIELLKTFANIVSTSFERKSIEENRIRSEHKLREANATKDKFFSIITRDLLSPFSDLTSLSSILLDNYQKWDDQKRLKFLSSIREASKSGYKLLENLITWSKMQSGQVDFFSQEVDVRSAISLSIEQLNERAQKKGIKITGVPEDLQFVMADYLMLNTIIRNLLSNAIKFTQVNGKIEIRLKEMDDFLEISVADNGVGIEKQHLNSLFRIDLDNYSFGPLEEKGTGLGLIICREFVEKNGGQIWVESELGKGSCFKFTLPLVKK